MVHYSCTHKSHLDCFLRSSVMNMGFGHDDRRIAIFAKGRKFMVKYFRFNIDTLYLWRRIHNSYSNNNNNNNNNNDNNNDDNGDDNGLSSIP